MDEIIKLNKQMNVRVLKPFAKLARQITDPSQPWRQQKSLKAYDISVADALAKYADPPLDKLNLHTDEDKRLWKAIEFRFVNTEVAPLEEMNFLGLLCKVAGAQRVRFKSDDPDDPKEPENVDTYLMRYWNELEIFRCADGCQKLATEMATEIQTKYGAKLLLSRAVTHIHLSEQGVVLGSKQVIKRDGTLAGGRPDFTNYGYVILTIPPSVWARVTITEAGKDAHPIPIKLKDEIGLMGMGPAVKFFSDVKERFWIKEKPPAAPYGGSLTIGQVWEGTDNQTRVGNQGIVLSVFAGPILPDPRGGQRVPTPEEFKNGLRQLYPGYTDNLIKKTLFSDWPNVPFIKTGYAAPTKGQIFTIGEKLSNSLRDRLFFAGEHTQMDFFGYMEGALRSGERAAVKLMLQSCGLLKEPAPKPPSPPMRIASSASIR